MKAHVLSGAASLALMAGTSLANITYEADFQSGAGPEWSERLVDAAPFGGQRILGQFSNQDVVLTLPDVREGDQVSLSFDFCAIRSWDGDAGGGGPGPDRFSVAVDNGPLLLSETFAVGDCKSKHRMSYSPFPGKIASESRGGSHKNDTLGYDWRGGVLDAIWRFQFDFLAPTDGLSLRFSASGLQEITDESWGLDNVHVTAIPAPGVPALVGLGTALIARRKRP
jgi:hypothetical protein